MNINSNTFASIQPVKSIKSQLLVKYAVPNYTKSDLEILKKETLAHGGESVEALIEVMKNGQYPDKNRWVATFLLGQIMGEKSAPFLVKFFQHPHWVMRMASLKTMLALKQDQYGSHYAKLLQDESMIVRTQALENIQKLKIKSVAPQVWAMLYDKKNYYQPSQKGKGLARKRSKLLSRAIETIGDLKFKDAMPPLLKMIQKDKYDDVFHEMDYALSEMTGVKSPEGTKASKRLFWQRKGLDQTII